jgi:hypothetical protein
MGIWHGSRSVPGSIRERDEFWYAIYGCNVVKCVYGNDDGHLKFDCKEWIDWMIL